MKSRELPELLGDLVADISASPEVLAVAMVGSQTTGFATHDSDVDLFVYADAAGIEQMARARAALADAFGDGDQFRVIGEPGHPNTDVWMLAGARVWVDLMFWTCAWAEDELDWRLVRQSAQVGYSTCFWRSIRDSTPLIEKGSWHSRLQERARSPYPDLLRDRIVELNRALIGGQNPFSLRNQIATAVASADAVRTQHRVTAWLASYFDVLFATNRVLHPGQKWMVEFAERECERMPEGLRFDVSRLIQDAARPGPPVIEILDLMLRRLDEVLD